MAPWKITGPASGPEWQEVPVGAEDYRVVAPACVPHPTLTLRGASAERQDEFDAWVSRALGTDERYHGFSRFADESELLFSSRDRSQPATVRVPWAEPERVYDVRYHTRDSRRKFEPVLHGVVGSVVEVTPATLAARMSENAGDASAFSPGRRHGSQDPGAIGSEYRRAPHLEQTNGGYT